MLHGAPRLGRLGTACHISGYPWHRRELRKARKSIAREARIDPRPDSRVAKHAGRQAAIALQPGILRTVDESGRLVAREGIDYGHVKAAPMEASIAQAGRR